jgi:3-oxoacyl-[acyl-carrier protein] reductase
LFSKCKGIVGDVTKPEVAKNVINKAKRILGGLDIVVCNVGNGSSVTPGNESYDEWQRMFAINFFSATNIIESSMNYLEQSQGSIVCISSICGNEVIPGAPVTYSIAKSALNAYVKSISGPLAKKGIRINSVAPGNINFKGSVWSEKIKKDSDSVNIMLKRDVPMAKLGHPDDVANTVIWLASDVTNFVTGSVITADGGQTRS